MRNSGEVVKRERAEEGIALFFDAYAGAFPSNARDRDLWAAMRRGIERGVAERKARHVLLLPDWQRACAAVAEAGGAGSLPVLFGRVDRYRVERIAQAQRLADERGLPEVGTKSEEMRGFVSTCTRLLRRMAGREVTESEVRRELGRAEGGKA